MTQVATSLVSTPSGYAPAIAGAASSRAGAIAGLVSVTSMTAAVLCTAKVPDALNQSRADLAVVQIAANHRAYVAGGWLFALALGAIVPFIWMLARATREPARTRVAVGALCITLGATIDIIGALGMVVNGHFLAPRSADPGVHATMIAVLGLGLSLDSAYNLLLGVGLVLIGRAMWRSAEWPRWLAGVAVAAGVCSFPVAFEWYSDVAGKAQYLSGTFFVLWQLTVSLMLFRRR